jgi:hypothetical protein
MVFACKEIATKAIEEISKIRIANEPVIWKSDNYRPRMMLCTKREYDDWFVGGRMGAFIDSIYDNIKVIDSKDNEGVVAMGDIEFNSTVTKMSWLFSDSGITPYSDNLSDGFSWSELPSATPIISEKVKHYGR